MGWSFGHATDPDDQLDFKAARRVLRRTVSGNTGTAPPRHIIFTDCA